MKSLIRRLEALEAKAAIRDINFTLCIGDETKNSVENKTLGEIAYQPKNMSWEAFLKQMGRRWELNLYQLYGDQQHDIKVIDFEK